MKVDFTKLIGFTVVKVEETEVRTKTTCQDCDCEESSHIMMVSFVNDFGVQQDVILEDGELINMTEPFSVAEDNE